MGRRLDRPTYSGVGFKGHPPSGAMASFCVRIRHASRSYVVALPAVPNGRRPRLFCRPVPASFCAGWRRTVSPEAPGAGRASGFARRAENSGDRPGYGGTVHQTWLRAAGARHGLHRAQRSQPGRDAARNQLYPRNGYGGARPRQRARRRAVRPQNAGEMIWPKYFKVSD